MSVMEWVLLFLGGTIVVIVVSVALAVFVVLPSIQAFWKKFG